MGSSLLFDNGAKTTHIASVVLLVSAFILGGFFISVPSAHAAATITKATGGANISIDTTSATGGSNTFTLLSGPTITEGEAGDITAGTHTLTLPAGWKFDTTQTVKVNGSAFSPTSQNAVITDNTLSFTTTGVSSSPGVLSFISDLEGNSIRVMPIGTQTGIVDMTHSGAAIVGVTDGVTSFGMLTSVPGAPTQLKIEDSATGGNEVGTATIESGSSRTFYSNTRDQFGNFVANVAATWSLSGATGIVDGDLVPAGDAKGAVLTGLLIGTALVNATADSLNDVTGLISVVPGPVSASVSTVTTGVDTVVVSAPDSPTNITVTVTAKDAASNVISDKMASIAATGSDNSINPASAPTNGSGVATFTISSTKAEAKTISATIGGNPVTQTQPVTFTHGPASQLAVQTQPSSTATAGDVFDRQPVVNVLDQFGNLVTDSTDVITAAVGTGTDVLKSTGSLTATAASGVATFSGLYYKKAESITIGFSSGGLTPVTSSPVVVSPNVPATVTFTTQPASTGAVDVALTTQPAVNVVDAYGNNVADGTSVTLSLATGAGALRGTLTRTTTGGTATFDDIGYNKVDAFSITATVGSASALSGSVGALSAGIIDSFTLSAGTSQVAGEPFSVSVSGAVDQYGNPASGTVDISASTGGGNSPSSATPTYGTITVIADGSGSANITLVNAVDTVLRGTVGSTTSYTGTITVNPAVASQVVLTAGTDPINASLDEGLTHISSVITGQLKDTFGNVSTTSGVGVVITTSKGAVTATTVTDTNGKVSSTLTSGGDETSGVATIGATTSLTVISTTVTFNDVTAPDAPAIITASPVIVNIANKSSQTLAGTAEAGSIVKIYVDGVATPVTTNATGGNFSFTNAQLQEAGIVLSTDYSIAKSVTVKATDAALNEGAASNAISYTQDTLAPSITAYTLDGSPQNVVFNPESDSVTIAFTASEPVTWTSVQIRKADNTSIYKTYSIDGSHDGTASATQVWSGTSMNGGLEDGIYLLEMHIKDSANNDVDDLVLSPYTITVDRQTPTVTLTYSTGTNPAKAGAVTITATYNEPIVGTPQMSIDQQGTADVSFVDMSGSGAVWTYSYEVNTADGAAYVDGTATISLSAVTDAAGNTAGVPITATFTIDTTPPTAIITSPAADVVVKNAGGSVSLKFDPTGGYVCDYSIDGGNSYTPLSSCASPQTITLSDGRNSVVLKVTDEAGNHAESTPVSFVVDTNDTLTVGASGADFTTIQAAIDAAEVDDEIRVAAGTYDQQLRIDKDVTVQGVEGAVIQPTGDHDAWDIQFVAGGSGATLEGFTLDFNGPTDSRAGRGIGVSDLNGPAVTNVTIQNNDITMGVGIGAATMGLEGVGIQTGLNADVSDLLITNNRFHGGSVVISDGNSQGAEGIYINPNSGAGLITISNNTFDGELFTGISIESGNVTVTGNIVTRTAVVQNTNGIRVNDFVGGRTWTVTLDNNSVSGFANGFRLGSGADGGSTLTVTLNGNTIAGNERGIWVRYDTSVTASENDLSGNTSRAAEVLASSDGTLNAANNWWGAEDPDFAALVSGTTDYKPWWTTPTGVPSQIPGAPALASVESPSNNTQPTMTWSAVTAVPAVASYHLVITKPDSSETVVDQSATSYTPGTALADGVYSWKVLARNSMGDGVPSVSGTFTIDTVPPSATLANAPSGLTKETSATVTVAGDDVVAYKYSLDGSAYPETETPVTTQISLSSLADGPHTVSVIGRDAAGNWQAEGSATTATWTVDAIAPEAPVIDHVAGDNYINNSEKAAIHVTGTAEADSSVSVTLTDGVGGTVQGNGTATGGAFDITIINGSTLADGTITPSVTATDAAGNVSAAATTPTATKDIVAPTATGTHTPVTNGLNVDPGADITVTFSEPMDESSDTVIVATGDVRVATTQSSSGNILTINPMGALESNSIYTVTLSGVTDVAGNPIASNVSWSFTTATSYSINLVSNVGGWNLVSLPIKPATTTIATVLGGASSAVDAVWTYDPSNINADDSGWLVYYPDNSELSNLTTMTTGYGYWFSVTAPATLTGSGSLLLAREVPPSRTLSAGWNLVGYYQLPGDNDGSSMADAFTSIGLAGNDYTALWGFNNASGEFVNVDSTAIDAIRPGDAFWISLPTSGKVYTPSNLN